MEAIKTIWKYLSDDIERTFVDLSKAFDTVDHSIFFEICYRHGFRYPIHGFLKSYLENRYQYVDIEKQFSQKRSIVCGVSQVSIHGPLLFLLNEYDLPEVPIT